jgi:hypothetical protein
VNIIKQVTKIETFHLKNMRVSTLANTALANAITTYLAIPRLEKIHRMKKWIGSSDVM